MDTTATDEPTLYYHVTLVTNTNMKYGETSLLPQLVTWISVPSWAAEGKKVYEELHEAESTLKECSKVENCSIDDTNELKRLVSSQAFTAMTSRFHYDSESQGNKLAIKKFRDYYQDTIVGGLAKSMNKHWYPNIKIQQMDVYDTDTHLQKQRGIEVPMGIKLAPSPILDSHLL